MKFLLKSAVLAMALAMFSTPAFAQGVQITGVAANGSGCPSGSVSTLLDRDIATVLFSAFSVQTNIVNRNATTGCSIALGLRGGAAGVQIALTGLTYSGVTNLSRDTSAQLDRRYSIIGGNGTTIQRTSRITRAGVQSFNIDDQVNTLVASTCNRPNFTLRSNTNLSLIGPGGAAEVDSLDVTVQSMRLRFLFTPVTCR